MNMAMTQIRSNWKHVKIPPAIDLEGGVFSEAKENLTPGEYKDLMAEWIDSVVLAE